MTPIVILNGGSSAGKTSIARHLQRWLGPTWMTLGTDDLVEALPPGPITFGPGGEVIVGEDFRRAEQAWYAGLAAIGRAGTGLILDEVLLSGRAGQERVQEALAGIPQLWVGVRCHPDVAEARERARPDRIAGMARSQAEDGARRRRLRPGRRHDQHQHRAVHRNDRQIRALSTHDG